MLEGGPQLISSEVIRARVVERSPQLPGGLCGKQRTDALGQLAQQHEREPDGGEPDDEGRTNKEMALQRWIRQRLHHLFGSVLA